MGTQAAVTASFAAISIAAAAILLSGCQQLPNLGGTPLCSGDARAIYSCHSTDGQVAYKQFMKCEDCSFFLYNADGSLLSECKVTVAGFEPTKECQAALDKYPDCDYSKDAKPSICPAR